MYLELCKFTSKPDLCNRSIFRVKFEFDAAVKIKTTIFRDVTACTVAEG
jgi:hypothetical protein